MEREGPPRQTLSFLRELFEARGLRPKSKLGQSFLIDLNLLELIARSAELSRGDAVLEVGTGTGSLTARLAERAGLVLGVELDQGFFELARENTAARPNVALLNADILKNKNQINPEVIERLETLRREPGIERLKLVSNLPYVVATPVISNFLLSSVRLRTAGGDDPVGAGGTAGGPAFDQGLQLAVRRRAKPGGRGDHSPAAAARLLAATQGGIRPGPPRAQRGQAAARGRRAGLPPLRSRAVPAPPKEPARALLPLVRDRFDKAALDERLSRHGFAPSGRAEALSVEEHLRLCEVLREDS